MNGLVNKIILDYHVDPKRLIHRELLGAHAVFRLEEENKHSITNEPWYRIAFARYEKFLDVFQKSGESDQGILNQTLVKKFYGRTQPGWQDKPCSPATELMWIARHPGLAANFAAHLKNVYCE